ncbi:MAG: ABC transporter ATP-binding protein [Bacteroidales bacterium]|nr:ABC transporter ATP-binding protein [Bacteroidales bacterium]
MTGNPVIETLNLVKIYARSEEPALNGISLIIPEGEIFGLLGPNGAGKTTTINILCGILRPTSGQVKVAGMELNGNLKEIKKVIGVVPQDIALYPTLTARENLCFIGSMYGLHGKLLQSRVNEYLTLFGLMEFANRTIKTYSGGMKRRINLIAGILNRPKILFLDEPTVGIDVQSRTVIIDYLKTLNAEGTTIVYTSHYMEEAEHLCTSIAIIDQGHIIIQGRPAEMIDSQPGYANLESIFLHLTGRTLRDH